MTLETCCEMDNW